MANKMTGKPTDAIPSALSTGPRSDVYVAAGNVVSIFDLRQARFRSCMVLHPPSKASPAALLPDPLSQLSSQNALTSRRTLRRP